MKAKTKRQTERKHSFQPRLEVMEDRCCPAVTMAVLDGHILQVLGDRGDNVLDFAQRGSELNLTFNGSSMRTFTGIDTVRVNTWAGRDTVRLVLETPPPAPDFSFTADLGAGDDLFGLMIPAQANMAATSEVPRRVHVDVEGGAGADMFQTFVGQLDVPPSAPRPKIGFGLDLDYKGGMGDDTFSTRFANVDVDLPAVQRIDGGEGSDTIENTYTGTVLDAPFTLTQIGGAGNDSISAFLPAVQVNAPLSLRILGGNGNDTVNLQAERTKFDGAQTLTATVDGGAGNDFIDVAIVDPVGDLYGNDRAQVSLNIDGGNGNDQIRVLAGQLHDAPDPELRLDWNIAATGDAGDDTLTAVLLPAVQRDGSFMASFDGGAGRDTLTAILLPAVQSGGSFKALFDGGAGRDTLTSTLLPAVQRGGAIDVAFLGGDGNDFIFMQVDMTGFTPESGRLRVAVDGGGGSDYMIFLVRGVEGPEESFLFTLDGGAGEDFAVASALVHAMNCEHVETL